MVPPSRSEGEGGRGKEAVDMKAVDIDDVGAGGERALLFLLLSGRLEASL